MRRLLAVLALCLLLSLAGCADAGLGSDPPGDDGPTTPTPTSALGDGGGPGADGSLAVHYVDVGQADATLLVSPEGETMLVDSGDWRDDGETVAERHLLEDDLPAEAGEGAVLALAFDEGDPVGTDYRPEETEERRERVRERFAGCRGGWATTRSRAVATPM